MKTTWIMQTNMGSQSDIQNYVNAVRDSGAEVKEVSHIPFSDEVPSIDINGPVVVYGAVSFVNAIRKSGVWVDGIFGTNETFTYEAWAKNYNEMLLNSPEGVELTTIGEFCKDKRDPSENIFVRPQHDTKSLVGSVYKAGEFKVWCENVAKGGYPEVDANTPILVAKPYGIEAEWRLFVVNHKVVGASQYFKNRKLHKQEGAPQDVLDFAEKAIDRWSPVEAYVLDVCRSAGNCYIVEAQGFNSAGAYAANMLEVAKEVNQVALRRWMKMQNKKSY